MLLPIGLTIIQVIAWVAKSPPSIWFPPWWSGDSNMDIQGSFRSDLAEASSNESYASSLQNKIPDRESKRCDSEQGKRKDKAGKREQAIGTFPRKQWLWWMACSLHHAIGCELWGEAPFWIATCQRSTRTARTSTIVASGDRLSGNEDGVPSS